MRNAFFEHIEKILDENEKVVLVISDQFDCAENIAKKHPKRVIDCGIAECNAVGVAVGLADAGFIPFVYIFSSFLVYRAYEFIRNDVCLQNKNIKLFGHASGISNNNFGPTHHTTEDIAVLNPLPNLTLLSPSNVEEEIACMDFAVTSIGPTFVRLGKMFGKDFKYPDYKFTIGDGVKYKDGEDVTIFTTGTIITEVIDAEVILKDHNISLNIINLPTLKPLDRNVIIREALKTGTVITLEEHSVIGGLGSIVANILFEEKVNVEFKKLGLKDKFCEQYGDYDIIKKYSEISSLDLVDCVLSLRR